jgi:hypothetical protein
VSEAESIFSKNLCCAHLQHYLFIIHSNSMCHTIERRR